MKRSGSRPKTRRFLSNLSLSPTDTSMVSVLVLRQRWRMDPSSTRMPWRDLFFSTRKKTNNKATQPQQPPVVPAAASSVHLLYPYHARGRDYCLTDWLTWGGLSSSCSCCQRKWLLESNLSFPGKEGGGCGGGGGGWWWWWWGKKKERAEKMSRVHFPYLFFLFFFYSLSSSSSHIPFLHSLQHLSASSSFSTKKKLRVVVVCAVVIVI